MYHLSISLDTFYTLILWHDSSGQNIQVIHPQIIKVSQKRIEHILCIREMKGKPNGSTIPYSHEKSTSCKSDKLNKALKLNFFFKFQFNKKVQFAF